MLLQFTIISAPFDPLLFSHRHIDQYFKHTAISDCLQTQETRNQPLQSGLILRNRTLNPAEILNMASKKVLVVFGATGMQGGSVVRAILSDPKTREAFTVRGVTRDVSKDSAKALESLGAETVAVSGIGCN